MEFKELALSAVEIKLDDKKRSFEGYASVFNGVDSYGDTIEPGAYSETLKERERPVRMRWNHFGPVIGKWLDMKEDDTGLKVKGELTPGHRVAEDVYASLKHGSVDGLSIGYRVNAYEQQEDVRILKEIELVEISVVEEPADLGANVSGVKHLLEMLDDCESMKEVESFLRESGGYSRAVATKLISRIKSMSLGEQERNEVTPEQLKDRFNRIRLPS